MNPSCGYAHGQPHWPWHPSPPTGPPLRCGYPLLPSTSRRVALPSSHWSALPARLQRRSQAEWEIAAGRDMDCAHRISSSSRPLRYAHQPNSSPRGHWRSSWKPPVPFDVGFTCDQTLGRRAVNLLQPEARGRINGLYVGLFFIGGGVGAAAAGLAWSYGGWFAVCLVAGSFGFIALMTDAMTTGTP